MKLITRLSLTQLFLLHHSAHVPYEGRAANLAQIGLLPGGGLAPPHSHLPDTEGSVLARWYEALAAADVPETGYFVTGVQNKKYFCGPVQSTPSPLLMYYENFLLTKTQEILRKLRLSVSFFAISMLRLDSIRNDPMKVFFNYRTGLCFYSISMVSLRLTAISFFMINVTFAHNMSELSRIMSS